MLSKVDLPDSAEADDVQREIVALNPLAEIQRYTSGQINEGMFEPIDAGQPLPEHTHHHSHSISTFSVTLPCPLDHDLFRDTLSFWIMRHAEGLLRMKGVVRFDGSAEPQLLNVVHDVFTSGVAGGAVVGEGSGGTLVFICRGISEEELRGDLARCVVGNHHDM